MEVLFNSQFLFSMRHLLAQHTRTEEICNLGISYRMYVILKCMSQVDSVTLTNCSSVEQMVGILAV